MKDIIAPIWCSDGFTFKRTADPFTLLPFDSLNGLALIRDHYRDDMMEWYDVPSQRALQTEGLERENLSLHLQTALMSEFSSWKSHCNCMGFPTKCRSPLHSLNQNMWLHWRHRHTSFLWDYWLQTWWTLEFKPPWFSMPSSLLSLISEGQSSPHAFSSASRKQGTRTTFQYLGESLHNR